MISLTKEQVLSGGNILNQKRGKADKELYFLIDGEEIVYVGQTLDLSSRAKKHEETKAFSNIAFMFVPKGEVNDYEAEYIVRFSPKYNKMLPSNGLYKNLSTIKADCLALLKNSLNCQLHHMVNVDVTLKRNFTNNKDVEVHYVSLKTRNSIMEIMSKHVCEMEKEFKSINLGESSNDK